MNNDIQSMDNDQPPQHQAPQSKKKLIVTGLLLIVLLIAGTIVITMLLAPKDKPVDQRSQKTVQNIFTTGNAKAVATYAGAQMYDACDLLSVDTIKKTIPEYAKQLAGFPNASSSASTSKEKAAQHPLPISITHDYIDRTVAEPLGRDGEYRSKTLSINPDGVSATNMESFISAFDAHCVYGQAVPVQATIGSVYVIQLPTPFNPEFLSYIGKLAKSQSSGMDVYQMSDSAMKYAAIVKPGNKVAAILKTDSDQILEAGIKEIAQRLATEPRGHVTYQYPSAYAKLTDPCTLFTADDFTKYTDRKSSAVTSETLTLTQSDVLGVDRSCQRLEADRLKTDVNEIAESVVTIRQAKAIDDAKKYLADRKASTSVIDKIVSSKTTVGDESYIASKTLNASLSYVFVTRIGSSVIEVRLNPSAKGYVSASEFEQFVLPAVQSIKEKFMSQS